MSAREEVLGAVRRAVGAGDEAARRAAVAARLAERGRGLQPAAVSGLDAAGRLARFEEKLTAVNATHERVTSPAEVPAAVARWLAGHNLGGQAVMAPDPRLAGIDWSAAPMLDLRRGVPEEADPTAITAAFAAIAETGTLMMASGPEHPSTLNFLPENHIVVVSERQLTATYEEAWDALRAECAGAGRPLPRTVNLITGPSRTGDIERKLELGAHGPRRLHVVVIADAG